MSGRRAWRTGWPAVAFCGLILGTVSGVGSSGAPAELPYTILRSDAEPLHDGEKDAVLPPPAEPVRQAGYFVPQPPVTRGLPDELPPVLPKTARPASLLIPTQASAPAPAEAGPMPLPNTPDEPAPLPLRKAPDEAPPAAAAPPGRATQFGW